MVGPIRDAPLTEGSVGLFTGRTLVLLPNSESYVHIKVVGPVTTGNSNCLILFFKVRLELFVNHTDFIVLLLKSRSRSQKDFA